MVDVVVDARAEVWSAPTMPWLSWNLQTNASWPVFGNVTSTSVSSPGWISWSTPCSASVNVCGLLPSFFSSSSTVWPGVPLRIVGSK